MALDVTAARSRAAGAVKSFSPQQLLILGALAIVTVIGLVALLRWVSQPSYAVLTAGRSTDDVAKVAEALDGASLAYRLSTNGTGVLVPNADLAKARLALASAGVPTGDSTVAGYDLLDKQGITTSEFTQNINFVRAKEGELAKALMKMDGIRTATVQLSVPEKRLFKDDQEAARASVLLATTRPLDESGVKAVMQTVAAAVTGLTADNVTVTDTSGQVLSIAGMTAGGSDLLQVQRKYESALGAQVESMLTTIYGPRRAVVRVNATMNLNQIESKSITHKPDTTVPVAQSTSSETYKGTGAVPGGIAGVTGQQGANAQSEQSDYAKSDSTTEIAVDKTEIVQRDAPGKVERLSVAVALDQNLDPQPDVAQIEQLVQAAVGYQQGRGDVVTIATQPFDQTVTSAADDAAKQLDSAASRNKLLGYVQTGGAVLVLLLATLFLRRGLKTKKVAVDEIDQAELLRSAEPFGVLPSSNGVAPAGALVAVGDRDEDAAATELARVEAEAAQRQALVMPERRLLDSAAEVLDLIDREPDDVAALLRSWVADRRS